jgi:hypothetical protein
MKFDNLANKLLNTYLVESEHNCQSAAEGCCCSECEECAVNAEKQEDTQE